MVYVKNCSIVLSNPLVCLPRTASGEIVLIHATMHDCRPLLRGLRLTFFFDEPRRDSLRGISRTSRESPFPCEHACSRCFERGDRTDAGMERPLSDPGLQQPRATSRSVCRGTTSSD